MDHYKIDDLLVIDFKECALDKVLRSEVSDLSVDSLEEVLERPRNHTSLFVVAAIFVVNSHHRKGLSCSRLSIGKNTAIVACH